MTNYRQLVAQNHTFAFKVADQLLKRPIELKYGSELIVQYDFDEHGRLVPSFPKEDTTNSFTLMLDPKLVKHAREEELIDAIAAEFLFVVASQMTEEITDLRKQLKTKEQQPLMGDLKTAVINYLSRELTNNPDRDEIDKFFAEGYVPLAYTETSDGRYGIQFELDLKNRTWYQSIEDLQDRDIEIITETSFVDGYASEEEGIQKLIEMLDSATFGDLVTLESDDLFKQTGLKIDRDGNFYQEE